MRLVLLALCLCVCGLDCFPAFRIVPVFSEESRDEKEEIIVREQKGLRFKLPADWPIERHDGVLSPVPVEKYLSLKFSAINVRLDSMEERISSLEQRLRLLEQELRAVRNSLPAPREPERKSL